MKTIVLLSDGTGNSAAKRHKTNVWRMYQALDLHRDDQVAFYDDGVGSQQFLPIKLLTGAFGWGLRRNVIRLYEVLCRNYRSGDRIYLFGYSRGAFTVRMLAGLVNHQGIYNGLADERELRRVARSAFEAYRLTYGKGWLTYWFRKWRSGRHTRGRLTTPADVEFIGVWDTVEAYGFPITELARFWDFLVLPLRFVKRSVPANVRHACQALSVDEERHSFHPVLWDESGGRAHIEQVWFAGSHADVGGGYPRHELALVPLDWMISKVEPPRGRQNGLHFRPAIREEYRHRSDWHGMQHDSRAGLAAYYRYRPRSVEALSAAACVQPDRVMVHRGVLERIRQGAVPYAPTALPEKYRLVDTPRGRSGRPCRRSDYEASKQAAYRMARMVAADDMVFLRRWLYAGFLLATLCALASMISDPVPWMTPSLLNGRWIVATVAAAVLSFLKGIIYRG